MAAPKANASVVDNSLIKILFHKEHKETGLTRNLTGWRIKPHQAETLRANL